MKKTTLVLTSTAANSNKFYEATLNDDGSVTLRWGRVGSAGQTKAVGGGESTYLSKISEKCAKGYCEVEVLEGSSPKATRAVLRDASISKLARPDFSDDVRIKRLVDSIVAANAHDIDIASGGRIKLLDNQLSTPLGVIGRSSLADAGRLLSLIQNNPSKSVKVRLLEEYLTRVPQKVGARRGWEDDLLTPAGIHRQEEFVQKLRDSLDFIEAQQAGSVDISFAFTLGVVEKTDERFEQVAASFAKTLNPNHPSRHYRLSGLYDLRPSEEAIKVWDETSKRVGNVTWLWHGTQASNVLSILSKGLYCPPASASFTTGRMFGNGIYGSRQSTKSLNYSGGVWAGRHLADKAFMFSMQAAMGKSYRPKYRMSDWSSVHRNYDSIDVAPGTCGVANHEAVVWNTNQLSMRYLCEFSL